MHTFAKTFRDTERPKPTDSFDGEHYGIYYSVDGDCEVVQASAFDNVEIGHVPFKSPTKHRKPASTTSRSTAISTIKCGDKTGNPDAND